MKLSRSTYALMLTVGLLGAGAGAAVAAIPAADGTVHACYVNSTGSVRVVDEGVSCRANESPLAWSQTGPQGPVGPQGEPGQPAGAVPPRATGASDIPAPPGADSVAVAICDDAEYLVQGGYSVAADNPAVDGSPRNVGVQIATPVDRHPRLQPDGILDGYAVRVNNGWDHRIMLSVTAWCGPLP